MKSVFIFLLSLNVSAVDLSKKAFTRCDSSSEDFDLHYGVVFLEKEYAEIYQYLRKTGKPCDGESMLDELAIWKYKLMGEKILSYRYFLEYKVLDHELVEEFNKVSFCQKSNWKIDHEKTCDRKLKSKMKFKLEEGRLLVWDNEGKNKRILHETQIDMD